MSTDNENIIRRVYQSIKQEIVAHHFRPGERLKIELLAEELRVSATPVREILNRLVAEGLIIMVPKMGFFMKSLVDAEIRDLYQLNQLLLEWSVARARVRPGSVRDCRSGLSRAGLVAERLRGSDRPLTDQLARLSADFFLYLATQSGNDEVCLRVANINDRLHYIRTREVELIASAEEELLGLCRPYDRQDLTVLHAAIGQYHRTRLELLPNLMTLMRLGFQNDFEKDAI